MNAPTASVALRGGLSGEFDDFDLLPGLLDRAARTGGSREEVTAAWSAYLARHGRRRDGGGGPHALDDSEADALAADAWRFAERMGLVDAEGPTPEGLGIGALADSPAPDRARRDVAAVLARGVRRQLREHARMEALPLLRAGARTLAATTNLWARECPGLMPVEVGSLLHWASVDATRAQRLLGSLVTWRDVAMHPHEPPAPDAAPGRNAVRHVEAVSAFYLSHSWLAERAPMSWAEELATCRLLAYCGLFRLVEVAGAVACWLVESRSPEGGPAC